MPNILYRETMTPDTRTNSSIKGNPLTYAEIDTNFKLLDNAIVALQTGTGITAGSSGSAIKVPIVTVNTQGQITAITQANITGVIQAVKATYTANADLTTVIPLDDTIPQNTEGTQILTADITPNYTTSQLLVEFSGFGTLTSVGTMIAAIFRDTTADAIKATAVYISTANQMNHFYLRAFVPSTAITTTTFKIRVGPNASNTMRLNGSGSSRYFGGISNASLSVMEIV